MCAAILEGHTQDSLQVLIARIAQLQRSVGEAPTDQERVGASNELRSALMNICAMDNTFGVTYNEWSKLGQIVAPDQRFHLLNWNVPLSSGAYQYHCLMRMPDGTVHAMEGSGSLSANDERRAFSPVDWYGALYYYVEAHEYKGNKHYVLLGWDGHDQLINKKLIEILWFDRKEQPHFGKALFEHPGERTERLRRVFEYDKSAKMTLTWLPEREMLVFDELIPKPGAREHQFAFYVPGERHHGYTFEKGKWQFVESVDMSRPKSDRNKAQFNFPERPDLNRTRSTANPLTGN